MPSSLVDDERVAPAPRHRDRHHPPALERSIVSERSLVLRVAQQRELVELGPFDAGLRGNRLGRVDHRLARPTGPS